MRSYPDPNARPRGVVLSCGLGVAAPLSPIVVLPLAHTHNFARFTAVCVCGSVVFRVRAQSGPAPLARFPLSLIVLLLRPAPRLALACRKFHTHTQPSHCPNNITPLYKVVEGVPRARVRQHKYCNWTCSSLIS